MMTRRESLLSAAAMLAGSLWGRLVGPKPAATTCQPATALAVCAPDTPPTVYEDSDLRVTIELSTRTGHPYGPTIEITIPRQGYGRVQQDGVNWRWMQVITGASRDTTRYEFNTGPGLVDGRIVIVVAKLGTAEWDARIDSLWLSAPRAAGLTIAHAEPLNAEPTMI